MVNAYTRAPYMGGKWFWIVLVAGSLLLIGLLEAYWRSLGYVPNVVDDEALWSQHRASIYHRGDNKIPLVLVGASRIQTNVSVEEMERLLPDYRVTQLAINGRHPLAVIRDLAHDEQFDGTVILSTWPRGIPRDRHDDQQPWIDYYESQWNLDKSINRKIATFFQSRLAIIYPETNLLKKIQNWFSGIRQPRPPHVHMLPTREMRADYAKINVKKYRKHRENRVKQFYTSNQILTPAQWLKDAEPLLEWSSMIKARGGEVLLLRMPTTGKTWALDQKYYPKDQYWDQLAALFPGGTIHFSDSENLSSFMCPDTSHLDYRDVTPFTRALVEELKVRIANKAR